MRIVSVNIHYQDKLGYQDYYLGKEWDKMGYEVHYVASDMHFDFPDYNNTVKHIIGDKHVGAGLFTNGFGAPIHRLKGTNKKYTGFIWLLGFRKKILELKPDILVFHGVFNYQTIRTIFFKNKLNCKIIIDDHTPTFSIRKDRISRFAYWLFRKLFVGRIIKMATKIIGITTTCIDVLRDYFGISGPKVFMIPLGADTGIFKMDSDLRDKGRKLLKTKEDELLVVYTGKMYADKKVHLIIDALNDVEVSSGKKISIALVGDADKSYRELLKNKIASSKCSVICLPTVSQDTLAQIYNAADICVWPDSLTTSTIDASACGSPIICSNHMPERVAYDNGILITGGNLEELKIALKTLIIDETLRTDMGKKGVQYVEEQLSWAIIAKKFLM